MERIVGFGEGREERPGAPSTSRPKPAIARRPSLLSLTLKSNNGMEGSLASMASNGSSSNITGLTAANSEDASTSPGLSSVNDGGAPAPSAASWESACTTAAGEEGSPDAQDMDASRSAGVAIVYSRAARAKLSAAERQGQAFDRQLELLTAVRAYFAEQGAQAGPMPPQ